MLGLPERIYIGTTPGTQDASHQMDYETFLGSGIPNP